MLASAVYLSTFLAILRVRMSSSYSFTATYYSQPAAKATQPFAAHSAAIGSIVHSTIIARE